MGDSPLTDDALSLATLRRLYAATAAVTSGRTLRDTLQAVADGVVATLGFGLAVVNHRHPDGQFEVLAVAGPQDVRAALLGRRSPADAFESEFALAEEWGRLRFVPHDRLPPEVLEEASRDMSLGWVPDLEPLDVEDAWHPLDALFAPLTTADGELVGMLSVDLPEDGRRPGPRTRELLELFAMQAGVAVAQARLSEALREERERLAASESAFRTAFDGSATAMAMISLEAGGAGRFLRVNDSACRVLGRSREELLVLRTSDLLHPEEVQDSERAVRELAAGTAKGHRSERRFLRPDGSVRWLATTGAVIGPGRQAPFLLLSAEDVTARKDAEQELRQSADRDPLTALPNRRALARRLAAAQEHATETGRTGAVLFCDLDGFKQVNDVRGHATGDEVLVEVASRLLAAVRDRDTVARLGGDEFVVVADELDEEETGVLVQRLREVLAEPVAGVSEPLGISVGTAVVRPGETDPQSLLQRADRAMYDAKRGLGLRRPGTRRPAAD